MRVSGTDGLYTLGVPTDRYRLPHPRLGMAVLLVVRRVLLRAFERLDERGFSLVKESEDSVTAALRGVIENDLRQSGEVSGFDRRLYESVVRQAQCENHDLKRLGKAPDLCFRLRNDEVEPRSVLPAHDALFVECKPVDRSHAAGSCYCDQGLCRFVDGDYAWAMEEALLLGYVRDGRTIGGHLIPAMQEERRRERLQTVELPHPVDRPGAARRPKAEALHVSRHRRGFPWVGGKGPATDILVYHSWHSCE
jgi:hypothetical protein